MIFGDGAAALVVAPAPAGVAGDVDVLQTYASGPESQVNSIIWPNVEFGCDITVYGPEVKALVKRYLEQMIGELQTLPHPAGEPGTLVDAIDLIIPHQANKRMVITAAVSLPPSTRTPIRRPGAVPARASRGMPAPPIEQRLDKPSQKNCNRSRFRPLLYMKERES